MGEGEGWRGGGVEGWRGEGGKGGKGGEGGEGEGGRVGGRVGEVEGVGECSDSCGIGILPVPAEQARRLPYKTCRKLD